MARKRINDKLHQNNTHNRIIKGIFIFIYAFCFTCVPQSSSAQKSADTTGKVAIIIRSSDKADYYKTDTSSTEKLIGNVVLLQGQDTLYCDTAAFDVARNNLEAFGDVKISQPGGTQAQSDYLKYTGNTKVAYMKGNVTLTDGKSTLWTNELTYNVGTKIGVYTQGGTLQTDSTAVSSNAGTYNTNTKDVRFTGDVLINDPQYNITSQDLMYNTVSKLVTFYPPGESVVTGKNYVLHTTQGTYDSKNQIAHFTRRSSFFKDDQYLEADSLLYDKHTGIGNAIGNVISIDTTHHTTMYCGHAIYYGKTRKMWATIKPVLKQVNGKDSLFIRADTFFSYPVIQRADTGKNSLADSKRVNEGIADTTTGDTATADSSAPRYFIGFHHVLIFSDSLQGRCDSISYNMKDSIIKMIYDPIAWSRNSQITGDTILLYLDSGKLKKLYVPNNALVVSQSGPAKAHLWDQVQGKTLTAFLVNNNIDHMIVKPNAESIYYSRDDAGAYLGVSQAQSERIIVQFKNQEINKIVYDQEFHQTMTPMEQADLPGMKLSRFKWLIDKRPKSKEQLFQ